MAPPRRVIRDQGNASTNRWNAFLDLISSSRDGSELTDVQCTAFYANRYVDEGWNGGHSQYFSNCAHLNHAAVERALVDIGAHSLADVLSRARHRLAATGLAAPVPTESSVDEYLEFDRLSGLHGLDQEALDCRPPVDELLEKYLDTHEAEFIAWID